MMLPTTLLLLMLVATPRPTPEVDLRWRAPRGCPEKAALLADVQALTGRPLGQVGTRLVVSATVTGPPWRARFRARSAAGSSHRELVGEGCDDLARAAAVIVAIALADARRQPETAPLPEPGRRPQPAVLTTPALATRWPTIPRVWAAGGAHAGVFPNVGPEISAGLSLTRADVRGRLGAYGRWGPEQATEGRTLTYDGVGGRLEGCWFRGRRRWAVEACAGAEAGAWWVTDAASGRFPANPWVAVIAGGGAELQLGGPVWGLARVGFGFPLSRAEIQVTTTPGRPDLNVTVFRPSAAVGRFELGLAVRFR